MRKAAALILMAAVALPLLAGVSRLPTQGSMDNPTNSRVVTRYLERGAEEAGSENIVTAILLNYRGYDTLGEVTVIFAALAAVFGVMLLKGRPARAAPLQRAVPVSPVVLFVIRALAPFIALFSIFVILHGHTGPGGGFQGGTILGALIIASSLVLGRDLAKGALPAGTRPWLQATAVLGFVLVGSAGLAFTGIFLFFPRAGALPWLRFSGLLLLEVCIAAGCAAIVAQIFWMMEGER